MQCFFLSMPQPFLTALKKGKENYTMKKGRIRAAVFDLDGTLLDSMFVWRRFATNYLLYRGITPPVHLERDIATLPLGEAVLYLKDTFGLCESAEELRAGIDLVVAEQYKRVEPKPHARELLALLKSRGIPIALATMTDRALFTPVLERLGMLHYFSHTFTCSEVGARKDRPVIYERALAALGTAKEETAVFEDALYAVKCAKEAGFFTVAVRDTRNEERWEEASRIADLALSDFGAVSFEDYLV